MAAAVGCTICVQLGRNVQPHICWLIHVKTLFFVGWMMARLFTRRHLLLIELDASEFLEIDVKEISSCNERSFGNHARDESRHDDRYQSINRGVSQKRRGVNVFQRSFPKRNGASSNLFEYRTASVRRISKFIFVFCLFRKVPATIATRFFMRDTDNWLVFLFLHGESTLSYARHKVEITLISLYALNYQRESTVKQGSFSAAFWLLKRFININQFETVVKGGILTTLFVDTMRVSLI